MGNRKEWEYLRYYPIWCNILQQKEAGTIKKEAESENK